MPVCSSFFVIVLYGGSRKRYKNKYRDFSSRIESETDQTVTRSLNWWYVLPSIYCTTSVLVTHFGSLYYVRFLHHSHFLSVCLIWPFLFARCLFSFHAIIVPTFVFDAHNDTHRAYVYDKYVKNSRQIRFGQRKRNVRTRARAFNRKPNDFNAISCIHTASLYDERDPIASIRKRNKRNFTKPPKIIFNCPYTSYSITFDL